MKRYKLSTGTIRFKLAFGISFIVLSLAGLWILNNYYAMSVVRNQVAVSYKNMISMSMTQIDDNLHDIEQYILTMMMSNSDFDIIKNSSNEDEATFATVRLQRSLTSTLSVNNSITSFFVYDTINNRFIDAYKQNGSFHERDNVRSFLKSRLGSVDTLQYNYWSSETIDNEYIIFRIFQSDHMYMGAWLKVSTLQNPMNQINTGENGELFFTTLEGIPMTYMPKPDIDLTGDLKTDYMTGEESRYFVTGERSSSGEFMLIAVIPDEKIFEDLPEWIRLGVLLIIGILFFIPALLIISRKTVTRPMDRIVDTMRRFGEGDINARIRQGKQSVEFLILGEEFNHMADRIQQLQIEVYEEQLSKQKAQLQHLQLQINPHFF